VKGIGRWIAARGCLRQGHLRPLPRLRSGVSVSTPARPWCVLPRALAGPLASLLALTGRLGRVEVEANQDDDRPVSGAAADLCAGVAPRGREGIGAGIWQPHAGGGAIFRARGLVKDDKRRLRFPDRDDEQPRMTSLLERSFLSVCQKFS
jgi:hypothetical protein